MKIAETDIGLVSLYEEAKKIDKQAMEKISNNDSPVPPTTIGYFPLAIISRITFSLSFLKFETVYLWSGSTKSIK